jgi:hypothetical protein
MSALTLALDSAFVVCPKEYHIDYSGWNGVAQTEIDVCITAVDGTICKNGIVLEPGTTPEQVRGGFQGMIVHDFGCRVREVGKNILVLEAAKRSAIRSVEFKSKGWKPAVRVVLLPPAKK